jgi:DNA polymerase III subunit epsilon
MMREIVLDTETTGLDPRKGDRLIEIGAIELFNHLPTGQTFHRFINPERDVPDEAVAIHGITTASLKSAPLFAEVANDFLVFIGDAPLIIHNAAFDIGFINAELGRLNLEALQWSRVIDTLKLARNKFPMAPVSLDALCRRFAIDNTMREKHGALVDSELLAQVYLELIGGRQTALALGSSAVAKMAHHPIETAQRKARSKSLEKRLTTDEAEAHIRLIEDLGKNAIWKDYAL